MSKYSVTTLFVCLTLVSVIIIPTTQGANILFFFVGGSYSHKVGIWPMVTELSERGHNVTFLSPYVKRPTPSVKVHQITPRSLAAFMAESYKVDRLSIRRAGKALTFWQSAAPITYKICDILLTNPEKDPDLHYLVHEAQYDLIVLNAVFGECGFLLNYRYKAKTIISLSSFLMPWYADLFGFPMESSWVPEVTGQFYYPMGFFDRIKNTVLPLLWVYEREYIWYPLYEDILKKTYNLEKAPSLREIEKNSSLIFINNHFASTDFARSFPPFLIDIGGLQCWQPKKELPKEYQEYLDGATDGAVLMTFGSTIDLNTVPDYFKDTLFGVFSKFPKVRFLFKWDGELPKDAPKNLKASKWLPQFEILAHPNVRAFISHAGLNSLTEAMYYGVPVILMPLFADQDYNGYVVEAREIGIRLEIETLVPEMMEDAVREILTNQKYAQNMKRISQIFRDRPQDPIQKGVYWTEFVLRHEDTNSLKPLTYLTPFQQRMYDVVLVLWLVVVGILSVVIFVVGKVARKYFKHGQEESAVTNVQNKNKKKQ